MAKTGRYYSFQFSDDSWKLFKTKKDAKIYAAKRNLEITYDPIKFINDHKPIARNDNFVAGYQPHLGMYVNSKSQYKRILKQKGLVEVGTEKVPKHKEKELDIVDKATLKELAKEGVSDRGLDALGSGKKLHH